MIEVMNRFLLKNKQTKKYAGKYIFNIMLTGDKKFNLIQICFLLLEKKYIYIGQKYFFRA